MSHVGQRYYETPGHVKAAGIALSLVDIIAVVLRFMARRKGKQPLKIDDWLLLPATLLTAGVGSCLVFGVSREAFAYPEYETSLENPSEIAIYQMSTSIKLEWSISLILPIALACTKASFIYFYKRIFSISQGANRLLNGMVIFLVAWALAFLLATLFCCRVMIFFIWKPISEMAQCKFFLQILMAFCITGFVTDVAIISIPIPFIWRLRLSTGQKLIASASFLLGAVTVAAALARLIVSVGFVEQAADPSNDNILNITLYCYWGMVEVSMGVFAACLPTLQLFFRQWPWESLMRRSRKIFSSQSQGGDHYKDSSGDSGNAIRMDRMVGVPSTEKHSYLTPSDSATASQAPSHSAHAYTANEPEVVREVV